MFDTRQYAAFVAAVFVLVIVPGPNTMIIIGQSLAGRAVGLATVAGVELGTIIHTFGVAFGLAALLATSPMAFNFLKLTGVTYLVIIGVTTLLSKPSALVGHAALGPLIAFRRALFTNLLNPKSAVFFLAFLPQFVHPQRGSVFLQFVLLGLTVSFVGTCLGSLLVLMANAVSQWLQQHDSFRQWQQRITGTVFIVVGFMLALMHPA